MEKNQIFIKTGTKYKKMTRELLEESNLAELIGDKNKMVGIKPNLVSPSDPANGGTTHPEIVAGILEYLKENGFKNSMILEGSWVGDRTADAFEVRFILLMQIQTVRMCGQQIRRANWRNVV